MGKRIWKTADKQEVPMSNLSAEQLLQAFQLICRREYATFRQINILYAKTELLVKVKEDLIATAADKGVILIYPDQVDNENGYFGTYFENERKAKTTKEQTKIVLTTDGSI